MTRVKLGFSLHLPGIQALSISALAQHAATGDADAGERKLSGRIVTWLTANGQLLSVGDVAFRAV